MKKHPAHHPRPKPKFANDLELILAKEDLIDNHEVVKKMSNEKEQSPIGIFLKTMVARAISYVKEPVPVFVASKDNLVEKISNEIDVIDHIKALAAQKIVDLRVEQVQLNEKIEADILEIVNGTLAEISTLREFDGSLVNEEFSWQTLDRLQEVSCSKSEFAVPNENFDIAKQEFYEMLKKHGHDFKDPLVSFAVDAFSLTKGGSVNTRDIGKLRKRDFTYPEWKSVKSRLSECWDYRTRKMSVSAKVRETLLHRFRRVTAGYIPLASEVSKA